MKLSHPISAVLVIFICTTGNLSAQEQDTTKAKTAEKQQNQLQIQNQNQTKQGQQFIDEDGDGYNDNAPDHDGDGIPNGLDPDFKALQERQRARQNMEFVDMDGDGINDNLFKPEQGQHRRQGLWPHLRLQDPREPGLQLLGHSSGASTKGRGCCGGKDQSGRIRHGLVHRQLGARHHPQPVGPHPGGRGVEWGLGSSSGRWIGTSGHGYRYGRLDSDSFELLWGIWH